MDSELLLLLLGSILLAALCMALLQCETVGHRIAYAVPDFRQKAGFRVIRLPGSSSIAYGGIWLLDRSVGELAFTLERDWPGKLRMAKAGQDLHLEDFGTGFDHSTTLDEQGIAVEFRQAPGGPYLLTWQREGFDYALYLKSGEMGLAGGLGFEFVRQTLCSSL